MSLHSHAHRTLGVTNAGRGSSEREAPLGRIWKRRAHGRGNLASVRADPEPHRRRLLPAGIHRATLHEVEVAFGSQPEPRARLYVSLGSFLEWVKTFQLFTSIVIDGSFVTDKPDPGDIDAVLILPAPQLKRLMHRPDYAELANTKVKERFSIDLFIEPDLDGMAKFFQQLKIEDALQRGLPPRSLRGVLQVML
jgi:hypothetical protein